MGAVSQLPRALIILYLTASSLSIWDFLIMPRCLINIRCSSVVNYSAHPSQVFQHKTYTLQGCYFYITLSFQRINLAQGRGLNPNAQL